jgi:hypothetical protein
MAQISAQHVAMSQSAAAWLFAYSPEKSPSFEAKVQSGTLPTVDWWGWTRTKKDVMAGDRVFIYRFGLEAAIVATGHALGVPRPPRSDERLENKAFEWVVDIGYDALQPSPLMKHDFPDVVRNLTIIQGKGGSGPAMGTNFVLDVDQSSVLETRASSKRRGV